jgi:integrase
MGSMIYRGKDRRGIDIWELQVSLGFDAATGTYPKITERFHGPERNARRRLHQLEDKREDGLLQTSSAQTVGDYLEAWLAGLPARNMAGHSLQEYRSTVKTKLLPTLGRLRLRELRTEHVNALFAQLLAQGLAPASVVKVKAVLSSAISDAEDLHYVDRNVTLKAAVPRIRRKPMVTLTEQQTDDFLAAMTGDPFYHCLFLTAATTGMRRGELIALRETDIDLGAASLSVQRGADYGDDGVVMSDPKSESARRTVRLHPRTVQVLAAHSLLLDDRRRRYRDRWEEHGLVFPSVRLWRYKGKELHPGRPLQPHSVTQRWEQARNAGVVPKGMRFHDLRHTHATQLLRAGVNAKVVSERLGHANVSITLNTYAHVLPDMQQSAVDALDWLVPRD